MPATPEEEWTYWDGKAIELRRGQLATVQTAATKWSTLLTALLGLAGAAAFAGGLTTIDKLDETFATIARVLTTAAIVLAIIAIGCFSAAGGGLAPKVVPGINATYVRDKLIGGAAPALSLFKVGRIFALLAAAVVIGGSVMVLWVGEAKDSKAPPTVLAAFSDGHTACGTLGSSTNGSTIGGEPVNGPITQLLVVDACS
jgi:hypothetical protein